MLFRTQREDVGRTDRERETTQRKITTYFHVECSVCGRRLRVLIETLGQRIACPHCGRSFDAVDSSLTVGAAPSALERADQLLATISRMRARDRFGTNQHTGPRQGPPADEHI